MTRSNVILKYNVITLELTGNHYNAEVENSDAPHVMGLGIRSISEIKKPITYQNYCKC